MDRIDTIRHRLPRRPACIAAACMATALALAACNRTPDIPFAEYGDGYADKPDFAEVEYRHPLSVDDLQKLTPENIKNFDQEQLDQIYARLSAGPIPDGAFDGDLVFPKGQSGDHRLSEIVGGLGGMAVEWKTLKLEELGRALWKGKVFYRDQRLLRNRIEDTRLLQPLVGSDLGDIPKTTVNGEDQWLLFPAKLYCGQSRSEEHTSELQSLMRTSYDVLCSKKKKQNKVTSYMSN